MKTAIPAESFEHGDHRRYTRGCRCRPCTRAVCDHQRRLRYFRQTGRAASISPKAAAHHVHLLRAAGMSDRSIISAASIWPDLFYRVLRGTGEIHRSTEQRILAVTPQPDGSKGSGTHIPATGTIRRLRALAADGWTAGELGRRAGKHKQFIVYLQNSPDGARVRMWVADYVRDLYDELNGMKPEDAGVAPQRAARTRAVAADKGWTGTAYWDPEDLDDPDFQPATSEPQKRDEVAAIRRAEIEHLASFGLSEYEIGARLDMNPNYVRAIAQEIRTGQRRERQQTAA